MALIRRYGEFPAMFVPDEGEVVLASVHGSPAGPFRRAAVRYVRRADNDFIRVGLVWLEACEATRTARAIEPGDTGHVYIRRDDRVPLLRRVPVDKAG